MSRLTFFQLFRVIDSNTLEILKKVKIGPVDFDKGSTITKGTLIAGLDFFKYINMNANIEVHELNDGLVMDSVSYKENS